MLTSSVVESALETLGHIVATGPVTLPEMTELTDRSKSTVTRHVNALDDAGLVTTWRYGSTKVAEAALSGRLRVESA